MTKYQQKRAFINKINKRIKTLVNRAGVELDDIMSKLDDIDGVYFTDSDNLNIDTAYFDEDLVKRIEKEIPSWLSAYDREAKDIQAYAEKSGLVGPVDLRPEAVNRAVAQRFTVDADFEKDVQKYYKWEETQNEIELAGNQNATKIRELLSDFGKAWYDERYAEARGILREMKEEYGVNIKGLGW